MQNILEQVFIEYMLLLRFNALNTSSHHALSRTVAAVQRMMNIRERVKSLSPLQLNNDWEEVRRSILWAGGMRDMPTARPGSGYTGHSFNDYNHCDLTAMNDEVSHNENEGKVVGIHFSNKLGPGIRVASLPEPGPGGDESFRCGCG